MKKIFLLAVVATLFSASAFAKTKCFLVYENGRELAREGDACKSRHSPCSTFKIAIALMGYDAGILIDEHHPLLPFKAGYLDWNPAWKKPHDPMMWMKNSTVWYSQVVTKKLGEKKFQAYLKKFNYGNQDASGDASMNNGLTESWLSSSLKISPKEQILFLQKLLDEKLPVSKQAQEMTKNIIFVQEIEGWKIFGKTGSGDFYDANGELNPKKQIGWFVGWATKDDRSVIFAHYVEDEEKLGYAGGRIAREDVLKKLPALF